MGLMAISVLVLLAVAIYSLSRLNSSSTTNTELWSNSDHLPAPKIEILSGPQDVPAFQFVDGETTLSPESFNGQWTLLVFWSYACSSCISELRGLDQLAVNWQGPEFEVITVNLDKSENEQAKHLLGEQELSLPTLFDGNGILRKAFSIPETLGDLPRHVLISPDRKMMWQNKGALSWGDGAARDQLTKIMELHTPPPQDSFPEENSGSPSPETQE